ncbi:hypothetical protein FO470_04930 [Starkeya sp. 3C]|uniref:Uncharacterized protein n=1 Tax=Ancylobacter moscoviensis TaxID=2597768 RepID=A0ABY3DWQ1_9HYPH|nr:hypothetical protein [Ancylobacter moscoviensis]TSJ64606.1 hypothetical protein FO470_04930 [Ancylobacter moscoviensis]
MKRAVREMPLYPSEAEIARELLGPNRAGEWRGLAALLERKGLPTVDPLFGGRYWPAVKAYLDRRAGLVNVAVPSVPDGEENWSCLNEGSRRQA